MYYGPQGNKVHSWLLTKKSYHRYCGTLFVATAFFTTWVIFLYQPLASMIDIERERSYAFQEQCSNGAAAQEGCKKLEQQVKDNKLLLERSSQIEQDSNHENLTFLLDTVESAGLVVNGCACADENECEGLVENCLNFKMHGSMQQLITFFDKLVQSRKYIGCSELSFVSDSDKVLDISCQFYYVA